MKDFNENEAIDTLFQLLMPSNDKKLTITETVKSIEESKKYLKAIYEKGFKDGANTEKSKISKLN